ncbi:MAG TPA: molybdate ABC transporter substrate-binding protein [Usitatibacter sp.]|nr:molybdate ABC transporter substrate-binding protein [Usitatibacter sp.]
MSRWHRAGAVLLALFLSAPVAADSITVFADASLKAGLDAVANAFKAKSGHDVAVSYGPTPLLARHIQNGAPADLFITDEPQLVDGLEARQMIVPGSRKPLVASELVLVAPSGSTAEAKLAPGVNLAALLGEGRLVMAHPDQTPAGRNGKAALTAVGAWNSILPRISGAPNGRVAVAAVARGQFPLGIAARSEAMADKGVRIVDAFPSGSHPRAIFTMALVARMSPPAAFDLADYLATREAAEMFQRSGFDSP